MKTAFLAKKKRDEVNETKRAAAAALFLFRFRPRVTGHVGALHPASPCSTVGPRQLRRLFPGARASMLAPCTPQALVPSSDRANPGAFFTERGLPCWRLASRKPVLHRRATPTPGARPFMLASCTPQALVPLSATPTPAPFPRRAAFPVGALHPASPCSFVGPRQHRCRALIRFAHACRQSQ